MSVASGSAGGFQQVVFGAWHFSSVGVQVKPSHGTLPRGQRTECGPSPEELGGGGGGGEQRLHSEDIVSFPAFPLSFQQHKKLPSIKSQEIKLYGFMCFERFKVLYMSNFFITNPWEVVVTQ